MRASRSLTVGVLFLLAAGCGGKSPSSGSANGTTASDHVDWTFRSQATTPRGQPVRFRHEFEVGEGVRMVTHTKGTTRMENGGTSTSTPVDTTMVMSMRCTKVQQGGDRVVEGTIEKFAMEGQAKMPFDMTAVHAEMTVGPDGKVKHMDLKGLPPIVGQPFRSVFEGGGFSAFLPTPEEGLRVGQRIDVRDAMPVGKLREAMRQMPGAAKMSPDFQGEYVLRGTKTFDGSPAAEFAVNVLMTMEGGEGATRMKMKTRVSGTQYTDLRTGWPAGTSHIVQDMVMEMGGDSAQGRTMRTHSEATFQVERLK